VTDAVRDTGNVSRRAALRLVGGSVASLLAPPSLAAVRDHAVGQRSLSLYNRHTGERKAVTYWGDGNYKPRALEEIDVLLRDLRTDETIRTDVGLLDYLYLLHEKLETTEPFHVICGYRSPATNSALARRTSSVAWNSLHVEGRAIDIRLPGRRLRDVRRAALDLRIGGVGYYPRDNFLHIDTGAVRSW
jgi:uncharacterized protein YcbK (DUF882 family)